MGTNSIAWKFSPGIEIGILEMPYTFGRISCPKHPPFKSNTDLQHLNRDPQSLDSSYLVATMGIARLSLYHGQTTEWTSSRLVTGTISTTNFLTDLGGTHLKLHGRISKVISTPRVHWLQQAGLPAVWTSSAFHPATTSITNTGMEVPGKASRISLAMPLADQQRFHGDQTATTSLLLTKALLSLTHFGMVVIGQLGRTSVLEIFSTPLLPLYPGDKTALTALP